MPQKLLRNDTKGVENIVSRLSPSPFNFFPFFILFPFSFSQVLLVKIVNTLSPSFSTSNRFYQAVFLSLNYPIMVAVQPLRFQFLLFYTSLLIATLWQTFASPVHLRAAAAKFSKPTICEELVKATNYRNTCLHSGIDGLPLPGLAWSENQLTYLKSEQMKKVVSSEVHCDQ